MNKITDSDSLSKQIPKWVRIYGFGALMLMMAVLIGFSFFFKIERVASVKLISSNYEIFIELGLGEFESIRSIDTVEVILGSKRKIGLVLRTKEAVIKENNIRIPVIVIDTNLQSFQFKDSVEHEVSISIEKSTLMSKVFEKVKPRI